MTRAGLNPGTVGNVSVSPKGARFIARVRFCREDGVSDRVSATGKTKSEAKRRVLDVARERMKDLTPDASVSLTRDSTLAELAGAYLQVQRERNQHREQHYLNDEADVARLFVIEHPIGATVLRRLRSSTITAAHRALEHKPGRARQFASLIRKLCAFGLELDLLLQNPTVGLKLPRPETEKKHAATSSEVEYLLEATRAYMDRPGRLGPRPTPLLLDVADIAAGTALRIGEILALRWAEDVDLDAKVPLIFVRGTIIEGHGVKKHRKAYPKTPDSERGIKIPDYVVETLRRRKAESLGQHKLVFETSVGTPVGPHQVRLQMWKVRDWVELQDDMPNLDVDITMHALRRGAATEIAADHDIVVAASVLGNKQSAVTEKHYAHQKLVRPDVRSTLQTYGRPASAATPV